MTLKILFISNNFSPFIGGIEVISQMLAYAFTQEGHIVHLLTWTKDDTQKSYPFQVVRNPNLLTLFKEHRWADLVFENNPSLRLSWPGLFFNKASVISLQTWMAREDGRKNLIDLIKLNWLKRADKVISCSNAIKIGCWPKSLVIENPYQEKLFRKIPNISRDRSFIFLGRMVSDKGADLAIKAFYRVKTLQGKEGKDSSRLFLTMIGDGPERKNLEKLVNEFKLKDQVEFTGYLRGEKLVNCLNRHQYILVPSIWEEPFGIVVLEGMACGCIPIASNGGGLPEAVGKAGLIFKKGDLDDLTNCMLQILNNSNFEQQCRNHTKHHLECHQSSVVTKRYLDVIHQAYRNKRKPQVQEVTI